MPAEISVAGGGVSRNDGQIVRQFGKTELFLAIHQPLLGKAVDRLLFLDLTLAEGE